MDQYSSSKPSDAFSTSVLPARRRTSGEASVAEYQRLAQHVLPKPIWDFIAGGSFDEVTLRANRRVLRQIGLRQRVMPETGTPSGATEIFGRTWSLPVAIGPTGFMGTVYPNAEIAAARSASAANVPFCLSTLSVCPLEEVAAASTNPIWMQIYFLKDREMTRALIERAKAAGADVLVLGMDLHSEGRRNRDLVNGLTVPPRLSFRNVLAFLKREPWALRMLRARHLSLGNLTPFVKGRKDLFAMVEWISNNLDPQISARDVEWARKIWPGKLVVKGILEEDDAAIAVQRGADGLLISNHGGRQLDGVRSPFEVLPRIRDAVGAGPVLFADSGVRTGLDVIKGLALGARACFIGRAFLYGLAVAGEKGVADVLTILAEELACGMALTGHSATAAIGPEALAGPPTVQSSQILRNPIGSPPVR
jgi:L-lactate dehydrogenase (cytochrome)